MWLRLAREQKNGPDAPGQGEPPRFRCWEVGGSVIRANNKLVPILAPSHATNQMLIAATAPSEAVAAGRVSEAPDKPGKRIEKSRIAAPRSDHPTIAGAWQWRGRSKVVRDARFVSNVTALQQSPSRRRDYMAGIGAADGAKGAKHAVTDTVGRGSISHDLVRGLVRGLAVRHSLAA